MKVVPARLLDKHDKKRFVELAPRVDADAEREAEFLAMMFNQQFVRHTWRAAVIGRRRRRR